MRLAPNDPDTFCAAGRLYEAMGDQLLELHMYHRAHHADPLSHNPVFCMIVTYRQLGWWHAAKGWLEHLNSRFMPFRNRTPWGIDEMTYIRYYSNWATVHEHFEAWDDAAACWQYCYERTRERSYAARRTPATCTEQGAGRSHLESIKKCLLSAKTRSR